MFMCLYYYLYHFVTYGIVNKDTYIHYYIYDCRALQFARIGVAIFMVKVLIHGRWEVHIPYERYFFLSRTVFIRDL